MSHANIVEYGTGGPAALPPGPHRFAALRESRLVAGVPDDARPAELDT